MRLNYPIFFFSRKEKKQMNYSARKMLSTLLLSILLAGCATQSPISATACPQLPLPPVAQESKPSVPYLTNVQNSLEKWDALLKGSLLMR